MGRTALVPKALNEHQRNAYRANDPEKAPVVSLVTSREYTAPVAAQSVQASDPITVTIERGNASLIEQIAPAWRALCDEGPCTDPFFRPEWIAAYVRHIEPQAGIVLVTAWRDGQLRAVLPLIEERTRFFGVPLRRWRAPTDRHSPDRSDLVHGLGDREAVVAAIWQRLQATPGWDLIDLADVPEDGAFRDLLRAAAASGYPTAERLSRETPYVPLAGFPALDAALAHTNAKFRANVRRRLRNLEKVAPVRLARYDTADPDLLARFFAMEAAGWKGQQGTAIACRPERQAYYTAIAHEASRYGYFTLYALMCGDEPVAMHFGLTHNGRYSVPKLAYDERWHTFAPGHVLVSFILHDCFARGLQEFDFLGSAMPWKMEWAPAVRTFYHGFLFSPTLAGRAGYRVRFEFLPAGRRLRDRLQRGRLGGLARRWHQRSKEEIHA
jgi:CelD/BcsL family acetyltransferase involved in cellulose biosynthesis